MENSKDTLKTVFDSINKNNLWNSEESVSGTGSEISNTKSLINKIKILLGILDIDCIIDLGCGDFNWFKYVGYNRNYHGFDIVSDVIRKCRSYNILNYRFEVRDIVNDNLFNDINPSNNKLIISRDVLVHLSNEDINKIIKKIISSDAKYFLTTTFPSVDINANIQPGMWRPINISAYPFNFPNPIMIINEDYKGEYIKNFKFDNFKFEGLSNENIMILKSINSHNKDLQYKDKSMGLWLVDDIRKHYEKY